MIIKNKDQYNEPFGKYKILSSNAGVGSIVASKTETFFMPKCCSDWGCIKQATMALNNNNSLAAEEIFDERFVEFLKQTQGLIKLKKLIGVPHIELSQYNQILKKTCESHPLYKRFQHLGAGNLDSTFFSIPAIVFPRWFYSSKKYYLKPLDEWLKIWKNGDKDEDVAPSNDGKEKYFAPPRDPYDSYSKILVDREENIKGLKDNHLHKPLHQMPMVLICEHGHISDIPWDKYFSASLNSENVTKMKSDEGFDLFNYNEENCKGNEKHSLQFIENRSHAESWGLLKCKKCGQVVSLEGIMNIRIHCKGERPWISNFSNEICKKENNKPTSMRFALTTSNSVYYAENISSLFIPNELRNGVLLSENAQKTFDLLVSKWFAKAREKNENLTKEEYIDQINIKDKADDSDISIDEDDTELIKSKFLDEKKEVLDEKEAYRFEEYSAFLKEKDFKHDKLQFRDIKLPTSISTYFNSIKQVFNLAETSTQLSFSRAQMPQPDVDPKTQKIVYKHGQMIFSENKEDVLVLPANQLLGEGIFFELNEKNINKWKEQFDETLQERLNISPSDIEQNVYKKIKMYGIEKFYLLHTLSHILIKEFEFSCGYPSSSLKERLYYSNRMNGFLIYTADGAAGSMGGLVSQGEPLVIENILKKALQRAYNCSSDPLCWENKEGLTLASCFSCSMISETSCEERNLGLDRQILVDENFGYFRDFIF